MNRFHVQAEREHGGIRELEDVARHSEQPVRCDVLGPRGLFRESSQCRGGHRLRVLVP